MRHLNLATRPLNSATRQKCNYDPNGLPYSSRMSAMRTVVLLGLTISFVVMMSNIKTINILDMLPSSDHLPMQMNLAIDFNNVINFTVT